MSKDINKEKYNDYRKKKFLRYLYLFLALLVVVVEVLALFNIINIVWGIVAFIVFYILKKILIK